MFANIGEYEAIDSTTGTVVNKQTILNGNYATSTAGSETETSINDETNTSSSSTKAISKSN